MGKIISNEVIISALLKNGTIKAAASAIGITERSLYDRMNNGEFKALYMVAKADIIRKAIFELNNQIGSAVETIVEIMRNEDTNPAVRLQAAQTLLNNASKFALRLDSEEQQIYLQHEENTYSVL